MSRKIEIIKKVIQYLAKESKLHSENGKYVKQLEGRIGTPVAFSTSKGSGAMFGGITDWK